MGSVRASNGFSATPQNMVDVLRGNFSDLERRMRAVERPSGTQIAQLVQQVQDELDNIDATVSASIAANSYTAAVIDGKDVGATLAAENWVLAGQTITGGWSASDLYTRNGPGFNITATRVASWLQSSDGRVGTAASSARFKTNITSANMVDRAQAILGLQVKHYNYKAEIAKRDDPTSEEYVGADYKVHQEVGMLAEDLHAAGLWEFVIYERDPLFATQTDDEGNEVQVQVGDTLKLDESGQPIPYAIHYELFAMAVLAAAQQLDTRLRAVETHLGL